MIRFANPPVKYCRFSPLWGLGDIEVKNIEVFPLWGLGGCFTRDATARSKTRLSQTPHCFIVCFIVCYIYIDVVIMILNVVIMILNVVIMILNFVNMTISL